MWLSCLSSEELHTPPPKKKNVIQNGGFCGLDERGN